MRYHLLALAAAAALVAPLVAGCEPIEDRPSRPGITVEVTEGPDGMDLRQAKG
jgi:hypothetical protein